MKILASLAITLAGLFGPFYPAYGQVVIPVTSLANQGPGTLRDAVAQAQSGDTVRFAVAGQVNVEFEIALTGGIVIEGLGPGLSRLDGRGLNRIFYVPARDSVWLSGFTLQNGFANEFNQEGGAAIRNQGHVWADNVWFKDNTAIYGGAIENVSGNGDTTSLTLRNCTFTGNRATNFRLGLPQSGGAIFTTANNNGRCLIFAENCTFFNNEAAISGGALFLIDKTGGLARVTLRYCTITGNKAGVRCGGVDVAEADSMRLKGNIIYGNTGDYIRPELYGRTITFGHNLIGDTSTSWIRPQPSDLIGVNPGLAALAVPENGVPTFALTCASPAIGMGDPADFPLRDARGALRDALPDAGAHERDDLADIAVTNLGSDGFGSLRRALSLACSGDTIQLSDLTGSIYFSDEVVIDKSVTLAGNRFNPLILNGLDASRLFSILPDVRVTMEWLTFTNARPEVYGGGAILNKGRLTLRNASFLQNHALAGGALAVYGETDTATLLLENCTFAHNRALALTGGALDVREFGAPARVRIVHSTLYENSALTQGSAFWADSGVTVTLSHTLFAGNAPAGVSGSAQSEGHNLFSQAPFFSLGSGDLISAQPGLDPPGGYGGPTLTCRLQAGSPAIDAGVLTGLTEFDQRGLPRAFGAASDIGAYEYDPATSLSDLGEAGLQVFPNPATAFIRISTPGTTPVSRIILVDMLGRQYQPVPVWEHGVAEMEISGLPAGWYVVRVEQGKTVWQAKVLKSE